MSDPIPEGFLTLPEAYELHYRRKYGVAPIAGGPIAQQSSTFEELVTAFRKREIDALVKEPGATSASRVKDWWTDGEFQERIFNTPEFPGYASQFAGRTPYVDEAKFDGWSENTVRIGRPSGSMLQLEPDENHGGKTEQAPVPEAPAKESRPASRPNLEKSLKRAIH
jgi:hypothetical protein